MKQYRAKIKNLFIAMIKVGCVGFGGGNALIPIFQKTIVDGRKLISQSEYEEDIVVASITPGALPIEIAGGMGRRIAGWRGMIAGAAGMAIPGMFLTVLMLSVMTGLNETIMQQAEFLAVGITAFIACMLTDYIVKTIHVQQEKKQRWKYILIIAGVFSLTCGKNLYRLLGMDAVPFFSLATIDVFAMAFFVIFYVGSKASLHRVGISAVLCVMYILCAGKRGYIQSEEVFLAVKILMLFLSLYGLRNQTKDFSLRGLEIADTVKEVTALLVMVLITLIPAWLVTGESIGYVGKGFLSSLISFGGGDAYLTVADGLFVDAKPITEEIFYGTIVPLVNIIPGSILCKTLSGIGYYIGFLESGTVWGGYVVALAGFACSLAASCGVISIIGCLYRGFGEMPIFRLVKKWIRPIVSGLMLNVILSLTYQNRATGLSGGIGWSTVIIMFGIYGLNLFMYYKKKTSNVWMVITSIVLSCILCNVAALF